MLTPHWLYASVLEYYWRDRDLPPITSPHNAYWFWRNEAAGRDVAIAVGIPKTSLRPHFAQVRRIDLFECEYCVSWRSDIPIVLATEPSKPLLDLVTEWKHFGILPVPELIGELDWQGQR